MTALHEPGGQPPWFERLPRVPDQAYRYLASTTVVAVLALIGTGGWVRLSESGLGCPTWPKCYGNAVVAHDSYHALVEFLNRCVITAVAVLIGMVLLGAILQRRRRPDLVWLTVGLFAGYVAEAVLGGFTVLFKLNPTLVAAHLVVAMLLLADAVVLQWRVAHDADPPRTPAGRDVRLLARLVLGVLGILIVLGTVATGSGPDAGSADAARFGFHFASAVELHADAALFLLGLVIATFFALRTDAASPARLRSYEAVLVASVLQGAVGYTQYFSGLPTDLIEVHILGAGILLVAVLRFNLGLNGRRPRSPLPAGPRLAAERAATVVATAVPVGAGGAARDVVHSGEG